MAFFSGRDELMRWLREKPNRVDDGRQVSA
jgi:hypothetical protein